jgi:hypothetical protein
MFLEDDDLFGGSPSKKYFDIIFNANRNLVEFALTENLEKIAVLEMLLEEMLGEDKDLIQIIRNYSVNNMDKVSEKVTSLYIEGMGDILSKNE